MRAFTKYAPFIAIIGAVTALHAQTADPIPVVAPTTPTSDASQKQLTVAEMQTESIALDVRIRDQMREVLHLKDTAKKQKDIIKLNCINDKLVQLKAQVNIFDGTNVRLQASLTADSDDRNALYGSLTATGDGVKRLHEEARACIGEPELFKSDSGVDVTHPGFPDDPIGDNPFDRPDGAGTVEPPGYASPFY